MLPIGVREPLPGHDVSTAAYAGLAGLPNRELISRAVAAGFDLIVSLDRGIPQQQNLSRHGIGFVLIPDNVIDRFRPYADRHRCSGARRGCSRYARLSGERGNVAAKGRIVFTGPGKTDAELTAAVQAGLRAVTVESAGELGRLERIAAEAGQRVPILLALRFASRARRHRSWPAAGANSVSIRASSRSMPVARAIRRGSNSSGSMRSASPT